MKELSIMLPSASILRLAILGNGTKPSVLEEVDRLRNLFSNVPRIQLVEVIIDAESDLSSLTDRADIALVLGGDGTVLHTARRMGDSPVPVLGINLGRLGFLAELTPQTLHRHIPDLAARRYTIENLMTLDCTVRGPDGLQSRFRGLNDVVLRAGPPFSIIEIGLCIDGESVITFRGDGLILATPVGSTAHSLSAGGPILPHDSHMFVVTPINAHTLSQRPLVDGAHKLYDLTPQWLDGHGVTLVVDGQIQLPLVPGTHVLVRRGETPFPMIRLPGHSFYRTLRDKLGWGSTPALDR